MPALVVDLTAQCWSFFSGHFFEGLLLCLAHGAIVRRFALCGITADRADIVIRDRVLAQAFERLLIQRRMDLFHFVGERKASQGVFRRLVRGIGDHLWVHFLILVVFSADGGKQVVFCGLDCVERP